MQTDDEATQLKNVKGINTHIIALTSENLNTRVHTELVYLRNSNINGPTSGDYSYSYLMVLRGEGSNDLVQYIFGRGTDKIWKRVGQTDGTFGAWKSITFT